MLRNFLSFVFLFWGLISLSSNSCDQNLSSSKLIQVKIKKRSSLNLKKSHPRFYEKLATFIRLTGHYPETIDLEAIRERKSISISVPIFRKNDNKHYFHILLHYTYQHPQNFNFSTPTDAAEKIVLDKIELYSPLSPSKRKEISIEELSKGNLYVSHSQGKSFSVGVTNTKNKSKENNVNALTFYHEISGDILSHYFRFMDRFTEFSENQNNRFFSQASLQSVQTKKDIHRFFRFYQIRNWARGNIREKISEIPKFVKLGLNTLTLATLSAAAYFFFVPSDIESDLIKDDGQWYEQSQVEEVNVLNEAVPFIYNKQYFQFKPYKKNNAYLLESKNKDFNKAVNLGDVIQLQDAISGDKIKFEVISKEGGNLSNGLKSKVILKMVF